MLIPKPYTIVICYTKTFKRTNFKLINKWSLFVCIKIILEFLKLQKPQSTIIVSSKFMPFNRFKPVQRVNQYFLKQSLMNFVQSTKPHILCLPDPHFWYLHNYTQPDYLILACYKSILKQKNSHVIYKDFFRKGWTFVYKFGLEPSAQVYKKMAINKVILALKTKQ